MCSIPGRSASYASRSATRSSSTVSIPLSRNTIAELHQLPPSSQHGSQDVWALAKASTLKRLFPTLDQGMGSPGVSVGHPIPTSTRDCALFPRNVLTPSQKQGHHDKDGQREVS